MGMQYFNLPTKGRDPQHTAKMSGPANLSEGRSQIKAQILILSIG